MRKVFFILTALIVSATTATWACTNFIVGKAASANGATIISYAADSYALYGALHFSPAKDYNKGAMREVRDWDTGRPLGQIPQVAHTYQVIGNTNEHQLTIGETTWGGREELYGDAGVDYGSLIYIALERCKTAREAIDCMTSLVEKYGYASEGETFSIGDPNEVWILDMIGKGKGKAGAVWVATRVPDDMICAHANQSRITTIDFRDKQNWRYSKDVVSFARKKGYYTGADKDFSFQAAYNPFDFSGLYVCEARVWSFFRHFSDDMDRYLDYAAGRTYLQTGGKDAGEHMPLYIRPNHKVSVQEVMDCMRDEYQGTKLDITQGTDAGPWNSKLRYGSLKFELDGTTYWYERPTATQQTAWSFVSEMHADADPKVGGIFWFGVDDAACNCYMPFFSTCERVPECLREGNGDLYTYSETSAWWAFNRVANWAYTKYSRMKPEIQRHQLEWQKTFDRELPDVQTEAVRMPAADARDFVTNYCCAQAEAVTADWHKLFNYLMVKYLDGQERKEENGKFLRNEWGEPKGPNRPAFPEEYLRVIAPEVDHE